MHTTSVQFHKHNCVILLPTSIKTKHFLNTERTLFSPLSPHTLASVATFYDDLWMKILNLDKHTVYASTFIKWRTHKRWIMSEGKIEWAHNYLYRYNFEICFNLFLLLRLDFIILEFCKITHVYAYAPSIPTYTHSDDLLWIRNFGY